MTTVSLLLQPLPNYKYSAVINNTSYSFSTTYNTRQGVYHLDVADQDGIKLYSGIALIPQIFDGYPFEGGVVCMFPSYPDLDFNSISPTEIGNNYSLFWTDEIPL